MLPPSREGSGVGLLIAHLHRHLARLAIKAQEEPAAVSTTEIQRTAHRLGIALEALPQLIAYAIAAGHQRGETWQTLPLTPPQGRGVYTTE